MALTPLAIFAFRRPDHLRGLLVSVAACRRLDACAISIFCDGPRGLDDTDAVEAARVVAREWAAAHGAQVVERADNLGLARSIVTAATALVESYGRVIVVEDDMLLSPDFLSFMLGGLDRYAKDEQVMQISGFAFSNEPRPTADASFLPLSSTWGWATWRRAWQRFRWEPANLGSLEDVSVRDRFELGGAYPYATLLQERLAGRVDSWGILWYWAVFEAAGLVLFPRESLVYVGGADGTGTHCDALHHDAGLQRLGRMRTPETFQWPQAVVCDEDEWRAVKAHMRKGRPAAVGFPWLRKLRTRLFSNCVQRWRGVGRVVNSARV